MIHIGGFSVVTLGQIFKPLKPLMKLALVIGNSVPHLGNPLPCRRIISGKKKKKAQKVQKGKITHKYSVLEYHHSLRDFHFRCTMV